MVIDRECESEDPGWLRVVGEGMLEEGKMTEEGSPTSMMHVW